MEWTAITFLLLGLLLILVEVFNPGFFIAVPGGALTLGGALALAAPDLMFGPWGWFLWPLCLGIATAVNVVVYRRWAPAGERPWTMSVDSLPGETGTVEREVVPDGITGKVRIKGTVWSARSDGQPIPAGAKVRVVRAEGVHVVVAPA